MPQGKTIQIITFIAKLVEKKVWPHLVVVPNSTILNVRNGTEHREPATEQIR